MCQGSVVHVVEGGGGGGGGKVAKQGQGKQGREKSVHRWSTGEGDRKNGHVNVKAKKKDTEGGSREMLKRPGQQQDRRSASTSRRDRRQLKHRLDPKQN
jgi:hypothetical protein